MTDSLQHGSAAFQVNNFAEAVQWFDKALQEDPDNILVRAWLGQSLCNLGRLHQGTAYLREACNDLLDHARDDGNINFVLEIVQQLQQWNDFLDAYELGSQAAQINPADATGQRLLAISCSQLNKKQEALQAGEQALKLAPQDTMMQVLLGSLEADVGRTSDAQNRFETILSSEVAPLAAFRAHKELARVFDKLGRFDQVFPHLQASAELAASLPEYSRHNPALLSNMIAGNKAGFDRTLLGRWADADFSQNHRAPVFLMGFFRSGTTMTQEVLDAHPDVYVADEPDFIWAVHRELLQMDSSQISTVDKLRKLDLAGVKHLRETYWKRARDRVGDAVTQRMFVDKFTMNTVDLGLINSIFPDAKVVFVIRDPRDVCLSCFMQLMVPSPATIHLLNWKSTADFYAQVMDWWLHIKPQLTISHIEFRYEDAVAEFEQTYRKVFDFLGLNWDPAVVQFHEHAARKFIASPSRTQVTQPLYSSSVARWKHYGVEFAPIAETLRPYIKAFDYEAFDTAVRPEVVTNWQLLVGEK